MKGKEAYRFALAALCVALAAWLCGSALILCAEGSARREADPLAAIYTPEAVAARLVPAGIMALAIAVLAVLAARAGAGKRVVPRDRIAVRRQPKPARAWMQAAAIAIAALLIVLGALCGGAGDVLAKAANICTECIGLG